MQYLNRRFSNLTSLIILLFLTIGTAWLFGIAMQINSVADQLWNIAELPN